MHTRELYMYGVPTCKARHVVLWVVPSWIAINHVDMYWVAACHMMSHRNVQPHVSINGVACYRTEGTDGVRRPPFLRGSVPPISVLELTKQRSGWGDVTDRIAGRTGMGCRT